MFNIISVSRSTVENTMMIFLDKRWKNENTMSNQWRNATRKKRQRSISERYNYIKCGRGHHFNEIKILNNFFSISISKRTLLLSKQINLSAKSCESCKLIYCSIGLGSVALVSKLHRLEKIGQMMVLKAFCFLFSFFLSPCNWVM